MGQRRKDSSFAGGSGDAERIVRLAKGYRQQTVADAVGQTMRFGKVLDEWKKAPDVKRTRLYLETMERVLSSAEKIIIDSNIVLPFISLMPPHKKK